MDMILLLPKTKPGLICFGRLGLLAACTFLLVFLWACPAYAPLSVYEYLHRYGLLFAGEKSAVAYGAGAVAVKTNTAAKA
ncbi:MAG: hypothetical protein Q8R10_07645 [Pseudomonas sp.]|nr:hypothetical protein [Pseudomonas sp.]MDP3846286.1 hypothetical protein [Pseudomonas sp.]